MPPVCCLKSSGQRFRKSWSFVGGAAGVLCGLGCLKSSPAGWQCCEFISSCKQQKGFCKSLPSSSLLRESLNIVPPSALIPSKKVARKGDESDALCSSLWWSPLWALFPFLPCIFFLWNESQLGRALSVSRPATRPHEQLINGSFCSLMVTSQRQRRKAFGNSRYQIKKGFACRVDPFCSMQLEVTGKHAMQTCCTARVQDLSLRSSESPWAVPAACGRCQVSPAERAAASVSLLEGASNSPWGLFGSCLDLQKLLVPGKLESSFSWKVLWRL